MRLQLALPQRARHLRWRLIAGFLIMLATLLSLLTAAERVLLARSLEDSLATTLRTTARAGLADLQGGVLAPKGTIVDAGIKALAAQLYGACDPTVASVSIKTKADHLGIPAICLIKGRPLSANAVSNVLTRLTAAVVKSETARLATVANALALPDQPVAMLDSSGHVWSSVAVLSGDRERARPRNGVVLDDVLRAVRPRLGALRGSWTGRVATADGPYLVLVEATDLPVARFDQVVSIQTIKRLGGVAAAPVVGSPPPAAHVSAHIVVVLAHSLADTDGAVRTVTLIAAGGAVAVLALASLLSLLLVGAALGPLARITAGAERLARGDFGHRVAMGPGTDEIGRLASAFDEMAAAIAAAFATQRRFVADASHELRTPLTALRGYTDVLLLGAGDDAVEGPRILRAMQDDLGRMSRLVQDLLTLARLDGGAPLCLGPVPVAGLLTAAAEEGRIIAGGKHLVLCETPALELVVWGDRDRLRQVLSNLVGNACAYTQEGSTIRLSAARRAQWVDLCVQDNGPGIPADDLARLGERFYRGDGARSRQTGGSGLGIAIARGIAQAHGGSLVVDSVRGEGTTATVRLPLVRHAVAALPGLVNCPS